VLDPLIIVSYSLLQKISNSNSLEEGQSFFRYHMDEIPVWSALDDVGQYVKHSQQAMTLIHFLLLNLFTVMNVLLVP